MLIKRVLTTPLLGGFFYDDQRAIRESAVPDGDSYRGHPLTRGFEQVRVPARALGLGLVLEDGHCAWGDCMSVQYAGAGGRDPVFDPGTQADVVARVLGEHLIGRSVDRFRPIAEELDALRVNGALLHVGLRYGLSQALLCASAHAAGAFPAHVIAREYESPRLARRVRLYAQCGDNRYGNVDRMIMKRVEVLPHGLINNVEKFGPHGERFIEYARWVRQRVDELGDEGYRPELYFDLYGMPGYAFGLHPERIVSYLAEVGRAAAGLPITIESPANFGSETAQIEGFAEIRDLLTRRGIAVALAVDEWCNTLTDVTRFIAERAADVIQIKMPDLGGLQNSIAAVHACRAGSVRAYLGGSCTETDLSARLSAHVAVVTQPDMVLAKPGMGVDEAIMLMANEQAKVIAMLEATD